MKFGIQVTSSGSTLTIQAENEFDTLILKNFQKTPSDPDRPIITVHATVTGRDSRAHPTQIKMEFPSHD